MWNMKWFVILVITGAIGIVSKYLKNLETIPGQPSRVSKNTVTQATSHITGKVLQSETSS
jgi:hypothetical protein